MLSVLPTWTSKRTQYLLLSVALDPQIHFHVTQIHARTTVQTVSHTFPVRQMYTHIYCTRTAQVSIMKERVWTAASPVWTTGHACYSPYVPHIPKIKPHREINHNPWQTKKDRGQCDANMCKNNSNYCSIIIKCLRCFCVVLRVCFSVSLSVNRGAFSMHSFQLLLNELFWSSCLHSIPNWAYLRYVQPHTPTSKSTHWSNTY